VKRLFADKATPEMIERISNEKEEIYRDSFRRVMVEIPGLTSLLEALDAEGIPCAAASNSPKGNVDMVLDELGIRKYFAAVIDRDMVSVGKPDPELFVTAAAKMGAAADRCVVVEDSVSGFAAADNARMPYIVITHGADAEELKHATSAQAMFRDFTEITPTVLSKLFN
jgi:HAD superfamily hydrolase (TIGR01509 family)